MKIPSKHIMEKISHRVSEFQVQTAIGINATTLYTVEDFVEILS